MLEVIERQPDILQFEVRGIPGAQGSKQARPIFRKGADGKKEFTGAVAQQEASKKVAPWRADVKAAAEEAAGPDWEPMEGPCDVEVTFYFLRPKSHYRTGRNAHLLKDDSPEWVTSHGKGDLDKLLRSTCDALTAAGVWQDDSQLVRVNAAKRYSTIGGASIRVVKTVD